MKVSYDNKYLQSKVNHDKCIKVVWIYCFESSEEVDIFADLKEQGEPDIKCFHDPSKSFLGHDFSE